MRVLDISQRREGKWGEGGAAARSETFPTHKPGSAAPAPNVGGRRRSRFSPRLTEGFPTLAHAQSRDPFLPPPLILLRFRVQANPRNFETPPRVGGGLHTNPS